jgi:N-acetylmuramoyl-L-alanine amidase-like protein
VLKLVVRRSLTRRQALEAGALAAAAVSLRPTLPALAAGDDLVFELDLAGALGRGATAASAGGWRTTKVLRAPRRFDLAGLVWAHGSHAEAQLRARRHGGRWTRWVTLHPIGDHRPDHGKLPAGTEPAYTGAADELQLRLRGVPRDLRARFVRAQPTAKLAGRLSRRVQAGDPPPIIPRSAWGGDSVPPREPPVYGEVQLAFVHHTVTANDYTPEESPGIVLSIARYHRNSNGWNDIGYQFLVDKYGQIFEGRAGGIELAVVGAQAEGWNSVSTGIACLGDFRTIAQTPEGMDALARVIGWKLSVHGIPTSGEVTVVSAGGGTNRYPSGTPVTFQRISGHRDGNNSSCPGDVLYSQLEELRAAAAQFAGPTSGITFYAPKEVRGVREIDISGSLRFPDGSAPVGAAIAIEYLPAVGGAAWRTVATTGAGPDGSWGATATVPGSGSLRATFAGDSTRGPLVSPTRKITVLPRLSLSLNRNRVRLGSRVRVRGTADPATQVRLMLDVRSRRRWVRSRTRLVRVRRGAYNAWVRPRGRGKYRVSVQVGGIQRHRSLKIF